MRQIRYGVAASLDGYIADPKGGYDWIVEETEIDFAAIWARFDTLFMGRRTYELTVTQGDPGAESQGVSTFVFSRTLSQRDHPKVTIVNENWEDTVRKVRKKPGKDIWLFGGGELFRTMLDAGLVDGIDVGVIPVLLGGGIPMLPAPARTAKLKLTKHKLYKKSGILMLAYDVVRTKTKAVHRPSAARMRAR